MRENPDEQCSARDPEASRVLCNGAGKADLVTGIWMRWYEYLEQPLLGEESEDVGDECVL